MSNSKCSDCGNAEYLCSCVELNCLGYERMERLKDAACEAVERYGEDALELFAANARTVDGGVA